MTIFAASDYFVSQGNDTFSSLISGPVYMFMLLLLISMVFIGVTRFAMTGRSGAMKIQFVLLGLAILLPSLVGGKTKEPVTKPELITATNPITDPPTVEWSTVGAFVGGIVAVIAGFVLILFGLSRIQKRRKARMKRERQNRSRNLREVQGIHYALRNQKVTERDLRVMSDEQLQDKVDRENMLAGMVFEVREMMAVYAGSTDPDDQQYFADLSEGLKQLREAPELVQRKALAGYAQDLVERSGEVMKSVRTLEEG